LQRDHGVSERAVFLFGLYGLQLSIFSYWHSFQKNFISVSNIKSPSSRPQQPNLFMTMAQVTIRREIMEQPSPILQRLSKYIPTMRKLIVFEPEPNLILNVTTTPLWTPPKPLN
jgi:hypothetical protein